MIQVGMYFFVHMSSQQETTTVCTFCTVPGTKAEKILLYFLPFNCNTMTSRSFCGVEYETLAQRTLLGQVSAPKHVANRTADCVSSLHLASQGFLQG